MNHKQCIRCGEPFRPARNTARYCSTTCFNLHKAERNREDVELPDPVPGARWIILTQGRFALVDEWMYDELNDFVWAASVFPSGVMYAVHHVYDAPKKRRLEYMHQYIIKPLPGEQVDHKDTPSHHLWVDNRVCNLRPSTPSENAHNTTAKADNESGFKGVSVQTRNADGTPKSWLACIATCGQRINIGIFKDPVVAARRYDDHARVYHKGYARLNFPNAGEAAAKRTDDETL